MTRKHKKRLARIIIAAAALAVIAVLPVEDKIKAVLYLAPYLIVGWDVLWSAVRNIAHGQIFDEILKKAAKVCKKVEPDCRIKF